jgi:WD40 repeat protein
VQLEVIQEDQNDQNSFVTDGVSKMILSKHRPSKSVAEVETPPKLNLSCLLNKSEEESKQNFNTSTLQYPNPMLKGKSMNNLDPKSSARSPSIVSTSTSRHVGGVLINTKMNKKEPEGSYLSNLRYVQSIWFSKLPTWTLEFSPDCQYLATGGQDRILRIWEVISSEESNDHALVIRSEPMKEFKSHTMDIIDLSWHKSKPKLVITASHDKRVILWNIEQEKPSQIYTHSDIVTSVSFKPDDDIFATG